LDAEPTERSRNISFFLEKNLENLCPASQKVAPCAFLTVLVALSKQKQDHQEGMGVGWSQPKYTRRAAIGMKKKGRGAAAPHRFFVPTPWKK
jgi:hypothetical protein